MRVLQELLQVLWLVKKVQKRLKQALSSESSKTIREDKLNTCSPFTFSNKMLYITVKLFIFAQN